MRTLILLVCLLSSIFCAAQLKLYGAASAGGPLASGGVFSLNVDGSGYGMVVPVGALPSNPTSFISAGPDGYLYGMTPLDSWLFKMKPDGTDVRRINILSSDMGTPTGVLVVASDGYIYGTTRNGGSLSPSGVVFKIRNDGRGGMINLYSFSSSNEAVTNPVMIMGSDAKLYGAGYSGSSSPEGSLFRIDKDGKNYEKILDFLNVPTKFPNGLMEASDGKLYGMAYTDSGVQPLIFRVNKDGSGYEVIKAFTSVTNPVQGLLQLADGTLYMMFAGGGGVIVRMDTNGSNYQEMRVFSATNGTSPYMPLAHTDGKLYGVTFNGGANNNGTIFRVNPDGTGFEKLRDFAAVDGNLRSRVVVIGDQVMGFSAMGGTYSKGFAYTIDVTGSDYRTAYHFGAPTPASAIRSGLARGDDNNLYGIATNPYPSSSGSIIRINTTNPGTPVFYPINIPFPENTSATPAQDVNGTWYTTASEFIGFPATPGLILKFNSDGSGITKLRDLEGAGGLVTNARGDLIVASDGDVYGTKSTGGTNGWGFVYKIKTNGSGYTILRSFTAVEGRPTVGVTEGPDGYLYGALENNFIYKIKKDGTGFLSIYTLTTEGGTSAYCKFLIVGNTIFGAAALGGANTKGTVFKLNIDGSGFTKLHDFNGLDGSIPVADLISVDNVLYGVTSLGGGENMGTIFKLNMDGSSFSKVVDLTYSAGSKVNASLVAVCVPPPTPVVTLNGVSLTSSSSVQNQWYRDGATIPGATGQTYTATVSGNYSVKVVYGSCVSQMSDGVDVTACGVPKPTINQSGTVLTSSQATGNQWYKDGVAIVGETGQTHTAIASGSYSVTATVGNCQSPMSDNVNVVVGTCTVPPKPSVTLNGQTVESTSTNGNQWYKDGEAIEGATNKSHTATASGVYSVKVTSGDCISEMSEGVEVMICAVARPTIFQIGTVLTSSSTTGNQWYNGDVAIGGATGQSYTVTISGSYSVQVTVDACVSAMSENVLVAVCTTPPKPTITFTAPNLLTSSASAGNQWYLNGNIIPDATGQTLTAFSSGAYKVQVNINGCASPFSDETSVTITALDDEAPASTARFFPNPAGETLNVVPFGYGDTKIEIFDLLGRRYLETSVRGSSAVVDVSELNSGLYIIRMEGETEKTWGKFIRK